MKTLWSCLAVTVCLPASLVLAPPALRSGSIDVVFCVNTSVASPEVMKLAKRRMWGIVEELSRGYPDIRLRVGLYGYGAPPASPDTAAYAESDGRVHRVMDLTDELEAAREKLNQMAMSDGHECVAHAISAAAKQQRWSNESEHSLNMIVVVGGHCDRPDSSLMVQTCKDALRQGIVVNAIYCGAPDSDEAAWWTNMARAGGGFCSRLWELNLPLPPRIDRNEELLRFVAFAQTPYDARLAQFQDELSRTNVIARLRWDLVDSFESQHDFDILAVPRRSLPPEMSRMTPDEQRSHLAALSKRRTHALQQVVSLRQLRLQHIEQQAKDGNQQLEARLTAAKRAFDAAQARYAQERDKVIKDIELIRAVRTQAERRGLSSRDK